MSEDKAQVGSTDLIKTTTLGERGGVLLFGVRDDSGGMSSDIELHPWNGAKMRELGRLRDDTKELGVSEHVGLVLSILVKRLGSFNPFSELERKRQKLIISSMYLADVFYLYCYARWKSLGSILAMDIQCGQCNEKFKFDGDMTSLTVKYVDKIEDAYWSYRLQDPVTIRGKVAEVLSMGPPMWSAIQGAQIEGSYDIEGAKLAMVFSAVRGVEGREQFPLSRAEIDQLSGLDIESIVSELDEHHVGPDLKVEIECPNRRCKAKIVQAINWSYPSFFGTSSRSRAVGRSMTASLPSPTTPRAA